MSFFLHDFSDNSIKLKTYSGTFSGAKGILRIQLEIQNPGENLGDLLRQLENIEADQKAAAKAEQEAAAKAKRAKKPLNRRIGHKKILMLPAPDGGPVDPRR